jgi:hypothetical protein
MRLITGDSSRADERRLLALSKRLNQLSDRRLAGAELTLPDKCRTSAGDPKLT